MKKIGNTLILLLVAVIWGTAFVAQSKGMDYVEPFTYCAIRMLMGGIVLLPLIKVLDMRKSDDEIRRIKDNKKIQLLGGLCCGIAICISSMFQQYGVKYTTVGKASFITALYIVIVPIISIFLKKHVSRLVSVSVIMAVIGFYLLCISGDSRLQFGDLLVLICALGFSLHILVIDYFSPKVDAVRMSCMQFFICGFICFIGMFIFEQPSWAAIWECRIPLAYSGIMSNGVAYTLQIIGQRRVSPTIASLIMSLESVFGAIAGAIILHEEFTNRQLAGCVIIFVAVILAQLPDKKRIEDN